MKGKAGTVAKWVMVAVAAFGTATVLALDRAKIPDRDEVRGMIDRRTATPLEKIDQRLETISTRLGAMEVDVAVIKSTVLKGE